MESFLGDYVEETLMMTLPFDCANLSVNDLGR